MDAGNTVHRGAAVPRSIKRAIDAMLALVILVLFLPVLLCLALAIYLTMGKPVLFRQPRAGFHGRVFTLYKFRSMRNAIGADGRELPDVQRLTPLGSFLRKASLDELPQLWNILMGDMSFIGPRPLLPEYLSHYSTREAVRHEVRPGVTGWAQIHGRQTLPFSKRLSLDVWYVEHWNLWLDAKIALLTIPVVLRSDGVILTQRISDVDDCGLSRSLQSSNR